MLQLAYSKTILPPPRDAYSPESFDLKTVLERQSSKKNGRHPRRRNYEINRKYQCPRYGCTKAYGNMSHLNTHRRLKEHGPPLSKAFFNAANGMDPSENCHLKSKP